MPLQRWFRREAARRAGQQSTSRFFTLGGLLMVTAVLAGFTALIAVPLRDVRERQLVDESRLEIERVVRAVEEFRAREYRLPDGVAELAGVGYTVPATIDLCRFTHFADARHFDDHLEIALRHRGTRVAAVRRYPSGGATEEWPARDVCTTPTESDSIEP